MARKKADKYNVWFASLIATVVISSFVLTGGAFLTFRPYAPNTPVSTGNVGGVETGFDQYGYNYAARIFNGSADGVDRALDGKVWGDPTYAKDHLVMKWSKAWNDARFNGASWTPAAWEDNEWNGKVSNGSGEVWHYKIVWVGPELKNSPYWRAGGYAIWGEFEVIMDQGTSLNQHFFNTLAKPNGYGMK